MTTFLLIRHGESQANLKEIFCGQSDYPLTDTGVLQAQCTAAFISKNYCVKHIYASDLSRAYATAQAIGEATGVPVQKETRLREIYCGEWEEASFDEMLTRWPEVYPVWLNDIGNCRCPGGESVKDVQKRVVALLDELAARHADETVVLASHGCVIRMLLCVLDGKPLDEMKHIPWPHNASVTELMHENGAWRFGRKDENAHLGDLSTGLPDKV